MSLNKVIQNTDAGLGKGTQ